MSLDRFTDARAHPIRLEALITSAGAPPDKFPLVDNESREVRP